MTLRLTFFRSCNSEVEQSWHLTRIIGIIIKKEDKIKLKRSKNGYYITSMIFSHIAHNETIISSSQLCAALNGIEGFIKLIAVSMKRGQHLIQFFTISHDLLTNIEPEEEKQVINFVILNGKSTAK